MQLIISTSYPLYDYMNFSQPCFSDFLPELGRRIPPPQQPPAQNYQQPQLFDDTSMPQPQEQFGKNRC